MKTQSDQIRLQLISVISKYILEGIFMVLSKILTVDDKKQGHAEQSLFSFWMAS